MPLTRKSKLFSRDLNRSPALTASIIATIAASIIWGGAPLAPGWQLSIIMLLSSMSIAIAIYQGGLSKLATLHLSAKLFGLGVFVVLTLQIIPLPPSLWQLLPGREIEHQIYQLVGAEAHWHTISVNPVESLFTMLSIVPAMAVFLGILACDSKERWTVVIALLILACASIIVGFLQFTSGGEIFNFYDSSHQRYLLGFFANRNHQGLFIASALAFAIPTIFTFVDDRRAALLAACIVVLFAIGAAIATASRGGLFFATLSAVFVMAIHIGLGKKPWRTIGIMILFAIALFLLFQLTSEISEKVFDRYTTIDEDSRWQAWLNSLSIAETYFPIGSGLGTFVSVYMKSEPLEQITRVYMNHAHNDYIELLVELGAGAIFIVLLFVWMFIQALISKAPWVKGGLSSGAAITVAITISHSFVDYPLRTEAISVIFAVSLAILLGSNKGLNNHSNPQINSKSI